LPLCDENTPEGVTCIDEADPDTCEEGFADYGNGCEPEREPRICHPVEGPGGCNYEGGEKEDQRSEDTEDNNDNNGGNDDGDDGDGDGDGGNDQDQDEGEEEDQFG
jgi:hypothetical protein